MPGASDGALFYDQTSVVTVDEDCTVSYASNVSGVDACDAVEGGFYFDDPNAPETLVLCEATCGAAKMPRAKLLYSIGCGLEEVK
jgi:hypothetical protein